MKKLLLIISVIFSFTYQGYTKADALIGEIRKDEFTNKRPQVIDSVTRLGIKGATVSLPTESKIDKTDENGYFKITPTGKSPVILSVQKEGYRPFSLTLQDGKLTGGISIELEKISPFETVITNELLHLGDNSYSENSSGACQIYSPCVGPSFTKNFYVGKITPKTKAYVWIGSVIGIDTVQAMRLGQNRLTTATSTPMEIFINKTKIGELKINGDNQKIPIPEKFLKKLSDNELTVRTGKNKNAKDYTDYDDVQLMNLIVEVQN